MLAKSFFCFILPQVRIKTLPQCKLLAWITAAISAPKPPVRGASWEMRTLPVFFTDCNRKGMLFANENI